MPTILVVSLLLPTKFIPGSLGLKDMSEIKENIAKIINIRAFIFSVINRRITVAWLILFICIIYRLR